MERALLLLLEAAKGPKDLPDGYSVGIKGSNGSYAVEIYRNGKRAGGGDIWGSVYLEEPEWDCGGALTVDLSGAVKGWGPLLYDVAIEFASKVAAGLISDRETVSGEAEDVWRYYNTRRKDVRKFQLDDTENTLTPTERDNCRQGSAEELREPWQSKKNPLSKIYVKKPARVMAALKKLGKLVLPR